MHLVYTACFKIEEKEKKTVRSDYESCAVASVRHHKILDVVFEIHTVGSNCSKITILGARVIGCTIHLCAISPSEYRYRSWFLLNSPRSVVTTAT